jgi:hypothetical protein
MFDLMSRGTRSRHRDPIGVGVIQGNGTAAAQPPGQLPGDDLPDHVQELLSAACEGGPAAFVALAKFAERQVARYDAVQLRALGMIARSRPPAAGDTPELPFARSAAVDVAATLSISVTEAIARMQLAWTLTGRLSGVLEALEAGQINLEQAKAVARWSPPKARVAAEPGSVRAQAVTRRPASGGVTSGRAAVAPDSEHREDDGDTHDPRNGGEEPIGRRPAD